MRTRSTPTSSVIHASYAPLVNVYETPHSAQSAITTHGRVDDADEQPRRAHPEIADDAARAGGCTCRRRRRSGSRRGRPSPPSPSPSARAGAARGAGRSRGSSDDDDPRRRREEELERVVQLLGADASHAFVQTETCFVLSLVNGSRSQPLQRSRKRHSCEARHQVELGRAKPSGTASRAVPSGRRRG